MADKNTIPCVIYTRKSSDEGLDQAFNSLDAQYEACKAYVESQKHEGWKLSRTRYDDGGISGATLSRPGLERLLSDVDKGLVKMIVVYKIDRLTRSLADFARLVERMDNAGCSFVSVTQAFNTSNSMGRLTLNVLLSFAQFEREVTAERIRDKIAASKAKGMWMGGYPPIGYDRDPAPNVQSLVVNEQEARHVSMIFDLYERHGNLSIVERKARELGIRSKLHVFANGSQRGGSLMSCGQIQALLANPVYAGKIRHKDKIHNGLHHAIIDPERWQQVQVRLGRNARKPRKPELSNGKENPCLGTDKPLLRGVLFDGDGNRLTPSWSKKGTRHYRYYVSRAGNDSDTHPGSQTRVRLPALPLERIVVDAIIGQLTQPDRFAPWLATSEIASISAMIDKALALATAISDGKQSVRELISDVSIGKDRVEITLDGESLASLIAVSRSAMDSGELRITVPFTRRRRGNETRIVIANQHNKVDPVLARTLAKSHEWLRMLKSGKSLNEIAASEGHSNSYVRTRLPMALLSPAIQKAIINGRQPVELTADTIARKTLPICWVEQEKMLGFDR